MSVKYVLPYFIKSRVNEINNELNEIIPPEDICYDHMEFKEFAKNRIEKFWTDINKDVDRFRHLGQVIISYYPITNKDKVLKEYFISNKSKILETYEEFDKLFNEISGLISDYHGVIYRSRYLYKLLHYPF